MIKGKIVMVVRRMVNRYYAQDMQHIHK